MKISLGCITVTNNGAPFDFGFVGIVKHVVSCFLFCFFFCFRLLSAVAYFSLRKTLHDVFSGWGLVMQRRHSDSVCSCHCKSLMTYFLVSNVERQAVGVHLAVWFRFLLLVFFFFSKRCPALSRFTFLTLEAKSLKFTSSRDAIDSAFRMQSE